MIWHQKITFSDKFLIVKNPILSCVFLLYISKAKFLDESSRQKNYLKKDVSLVLIFYMKERGLD